MEISALTNMPDNFPIHIGSLLASCYEVQAFLGKGSFGVVAKCLNTVTNTEVAVKITKDKKASTDQAEKEIKILEDLRSLDPDKCNLVRWNGSFFHERFICLEFELLDQSLLKYIQQKPEGYLSLGEIRPILHQLATALLHLQDMAIMHGDVKPDNIMVVNRRQRPLQVKLIDFGLACYAPEVTLGDWVGSMWYRAPEVTLGLEFSESIDMWSLGVIAAELAIGCHLFPGEHDYDMMKFIVDTLGQPPDDQLNCAAYSAEFFQIEESGNLPAWRMKSPSQYATETGHCFKDTRYFVFNSLDDLLEELYYHEMAGRDELRVFVDLLKEMLRVHQYARTTPIEVLDHPFLAVEQHTDSSPDTNAANLTADVKEAEPTISQQPVSQLKRDHSLELCHVPPKAMTDSTQPRSVSAKLVHEEDEATLEQPEFLVETSSKSVAENLTADVKEAEPTISQQPVSQKKGDHTFELCHVPPKAMTPHDEVVCTQPQSVFAKLVHEEEEATLEQPEFLVETSSESVGCFNIFCEGIINLFSCCFYSRD